MSANSRSNTIPLQVFTLSITLQAPYLVHGNDAGRYGLHATLLRDHRRRPVLPGTLLAGRIAEVWKAHGSALGGADPYEWLGEPGEDEARQKGRRARLRVADLTLQTIEGEPFDLTKPTHEFDATRVQLDQDTGSVQHGALLAVEQVSLPGAELTFKGEWRVRADQGEAETLRKQLLVALQLQTQIGAWRNIGFGRVTAVNVTRAEGAVTGGRPQPAAWANGRRRFALTSDDALCLSASTQRGNVFVSVDHVSGGTIKGVLARMLTERHGVKSLAALEDRLPLARCFDRVRVTHALPAKHAGKRPVPLPQSLVSLGDGKIRDAFQHAAPPDTLPGTVAFQTDWKGQDFEAASANQGWGETRHYLRVRTDINSHGQAKDQALFAYDCRVAEAGTRWLFDIDLSAVPEADRRSVAESLDDLLAEGLAPIGKTDARAEVTPCDAGAVWASGAPKALKAGDRVPVLLVSDAVLFPTTVIEVEPPQEVDLVRRYAEQFEALQREIVGADGEPPLRYRHHFATQRLAGGDFLHLRYGQGKPYRPLVLTEAGSVFVFEVVDVQRARAVLDHWQRCGLALPPQVREVHGADWTRHPYLPENGHGEVAVAPQHGFAPL